VRVFFLGSGGQTLERREFILFFVGFLFSRIEKKNKQTKPTSLLKQRVIYMFSGPFLVSRTGDVG